MTSDGPALWAVSPVFETGPLSMEAAGRLLDYERGFGRSAYILPDRREYLVRRWEHWRLKDSEEKLLEGTATMGLARE